LTWRGTAKKHLDAGTEKPPTVKSNTWYILIPEIAFDKDVS